MTLHLPASAPLLQAFSKPPDPRKSRNQIYPLIEESQRQEPPPTLLTELYVSVSTHTAPIIQPAIPDLAASAQTDWARVS